MHIIIHRLQLTSHCIEGILRIDGHNICNTAENREAHLKPGTYTLRVHPCVHYHRLMPVILAAYSSTEPMDQVLPCNLCRFLHRPSLHGNLPYVCPQLKIGNGAANRNDGSIIIGEKYLDGILLNSAKHFNQLLDRLDKVQNRNEIILITIRDFTTD